jgi:hypothetical protein
VEAATWGFVGTLAGAFVGAAASIIATLLASQNATRLQRDADSLERLERARLFQRQNLLDVQDVLQDALRLMARANLEDQARFRREGTWATGLLSPEVNENMLLANRRLTALIERVANDSLRSELKDVHQKLNRPLYVSSAREAEALVHDASTTSFKVMEHLGEVLRTYY